MPGLRHLTVVFQGLQPLHLPKDVVQLPVHVARREGWEASIIATGDGAELRGTFAGAGLDVVVVDRRGLRWAELRRVVGELLRRRRRLDVVLLYHVTLESVVISHVLRLLAPWSVVVLKLDADHRGTTGLLSPPSMKSTALRSLTLRSPIALFITETSGAYRTLGPLFSAYRRRLVVVPNGFDGDDGIAPRALSARMRRTSNASPGAPKTVVSVARHGSEQKRSELLLEALSWLDDAELSHLHLVLVGPSTAEFAVICDQFRAARPIGDLEQRAWLDPDGMREVYEDADVYVAVTAWESFGLATLEAVASGVPCIATPVGVVPDLIDAGAPIHVLPADPTPEEVARSLREVLADRTRSEELGRRGAEVAAQWTYQAAAERFVAALGLEGRRRRGGGGGTAR